MSNSRHQCYECDWVYDQAQGWLEDGIAPGTDFESIDSSWSCPDCGADQTAFRYLDDNGKATVAAAPALAASIAPTSPTVANAPDPQPSAIPQAPDQAPYKLWECIVCGWVYDEAKGWPEDGIAPGTRWEDVPDDWLCPECGVGKLDFEMIEVAQAAGAEEPAPAPAAATYQIDQTQPPLVIIGTGLAGYNLARQWRAGNRQRPLLMISRDDGAFYSKPLLSTGYGKNKRADQLVNKTAEEMALELAAEIRIFSEVSAVDTSAKTLSINGVERSYGQLVFATGANCIEAPLQGNALDRVYQVNDLLDYQRFRTALAGCGTGAKVLIIGGGLIGSEYANDLASAGYQIEAVEAMDRVLGSLLPPESSHAVEQGLAKLGVRHHFNTVVETVERQGSGVNAILANGETISADLVLSAIGVRANTALAEQAGLQIGRGIITDRSLKTSADSVYALGDCAEVDGQLLYYIEPLMQSVKALAQTLNGEVAEVCYGVMPVSIKTPACPVVVCPPPRGLPGNWKTMGEGQNIKAEFFDQHKQLRGFALTGAATELKGQLAAQMSAS
ncbi:MAG: FAD-dependent oxidoreductase [Cellvibrionaceae bacterium]|nr:FAD-dependent oxidoreductase [Cellvibrionaceae bacterium]MCV6624800.1 FAD-dependent oxidoreductase [Cellvibrionaceae bacterium]